MKLCMNIYSLENPVSYVYFVYLHFHAFVKCFVHSFEKEKRTTPHSMHQAKFTFESQHIKNKNVFAKFGNSCAS